MIYDLQKATIFKRISAFLFDAIILVSLAAALAIGVSAIVDYDSWTSAYNDLKTEYSENYGIQFDITAEDMEALGEEEMAKYNEANDAWVQDSRVILVYNMMLNLSLIIVSLSLFAAFLVLEFVVPLFFGNGQTLGKKIFGVGVMHVSGVKISSVALFIRSILGKYAVETMIPVFTVIPFLFGSASVVGLITIGAIIVAQASLMIVTKTNSAIHDGLASTVTVDLASQMIFASNEELLEYKKRIAAEKAAEKPYC